MKLNISILAARQMRFESSVVHPPEPFWSARDELSYIFDRFAAFYKAIPDLRQLPHQLVHGDINGSNMLVDADGRLRPYLILSS